MRQIIHGPNPKRPCNQNLHNEHVAGIKWLKRLTAKRLAQIKIIPEIAEII